MPPPGSPRVRGERAQGVATGTGRVPRVAWTWSVEPSARTTFTVTRCPGRSARISVPSWSEEDTLLPSKATMTSPSRIPDRAAGPPGATWRTNAPWSTARPNWTATPGPTVVVETPRYGAGAAGWAMAPSITGFAASMAMENPTFSAPPEPAVLIPTTFPARSTNGPPELPGLIAASVWRTSWYVRAPP